MLLTVAFCRTASMRVAWLNSLKSVYFSSIMDSAGDSSPENEEFSSDIGIISIGINYIRVVE